MDEQSIDSWQERIARRYAGGVDESPRPQAVLIAGPRAAGKSVLLEIVCRWFATGGQCVVVNVDEILLQHPLFAEAAAGDRDAAEEACWPDVIAAADGLIEQALQQRQHLAVELRPDDPERGRSLVQHVRAQGHELTVIVLSVDPQAGRESLEQRAQQLSEDLELTITPDVDAHERSIAQVQQWLQWLGDQEPAVPIHVLTRDGQVLASTDPAVDAPTRRVAESFSAAGANEEARSQASGEHATTRQERSAPSTVQLGGRRIKLGAFAPPPVAKVSAPPAPPARPIAPGAAQTDAGDSVPRQRGMKLGAFRSTGNAPQSDHAPSPASGRSSMPIEDGVEPPVRRPPPVVPPDPPVIDRPDSSADTDEPPLPAGTAAGLREPPQIELDSLPAAKQRTVEHRMGLQRRIRIRAGLEAPEQQVGPSQ